MEKPLCDAQYVVASVRLESKYDDARVVAGWIRPEVREVLVECDDGAELAKADGRFSSSLNRTSKLTYRARERTRSFASSAA